MKIARTLDVLEEVQSSMIKHEKDNFTVRSLNGFWSREHEERVFHEVWRAVIKWLSAL